MEKKKKDNRGGVRKGQGRPKGSKTKKKIELEEAELTFRKWASKDLQDLYAAYIDLALGVKCEKPVWSNGKVIRTEIYQRPPDRSALNDLTSRVMGKIKDEFGVSFDVKNVKETQEVLKKIFSEK
jgi:hypothetical protein